MAHKEQWKVLASQLITSLVGFEVYRLFIAKIIKLFYLLLTAHLCSQNQKTTVSLYNTCYQTSSKVERVYA